MAFQKELAYETEDKCRIIFEEPIEKIVSASVRLKLLFQAWGQCLTLFSKFCQKTERIKQGLSQALSQDFG